MRGSVPSTANAGAFSTTVFLAGLAFWQEEKATLEIDVLPFQVQDFP
jgi:hypothetical protein